MLFIENLDVFYGAIHALKGVSLKVNEGEIVTIVGANGAGKSTLLRTISGLVWSRSGKTRLGDLDITGLPTHKIAALGIGHCPEGRRVFGPLTVWENLKMGAYLEKNRRVIQDRAEMVFTLFPRLKERIGQRVGTLSGGEQQMLAIARAMMNNPRVLLMDEPSLGLAPILVKSIFPIIREINRTGTTVLLVEQNAHMALGVAHRAYVFETGRVVAEGPAAELAKDPAIQNAYLGKQVKAQ